MPYGAKAVCARSKGNLNNLVLVMGNMGNKSVLLEFVNSALGNDDRVREVIKQGFRILIMDGQDT